MFLGLALISCAASQTGNAPTASQTGNAPAKSGAHVREEGIQSGHAREDLLAGNQRFIDGGMDAHSWQQEKVIHTGEFGQSPSVGVLSCSDSRVPVEIIFDQGVGSLFVVRLAGNIDSVEGTATFEYGFKALGMNSILVLGHTKCGAVVATVEGKPLPGTIGLLAKQIAPAVAELVKNKKFAKPEDLINAAVEANVRYQMKVLLERSEIIRGAVAAQQLQLFGGIYDVDTGRVRFLN